MTESKEEKQPAKQRSWLERLSALIAREPKTREQVMEVLRDAEDRNILSEDILGMIERILQVSEIQVDEIMIPKAKMVVIKKDHTLKEVLPIVIESGHSRFPVLDPVNGNIIGMLLAKDLLKFYFKKSADQFRLLEIMRPAIYTPQSKRLDVLLREFRSNRNHIAIVLDEYAHVVGLVTIEDVLEQIVGEIQDEYDIEENDVYIKKHINDTYIVKAQMPIEEFNQYFATNFSDEEFDTIGGIVLQHFGHLPKRGEKIKFENFRFKVLHSDNRRIYLLEVKRAKRQPSTTR